MIRICISIILVAFLNDPCSAQFEIDNDIILNGISATERQIEGLGDPVEETDLINVSSFRSNKARYTIANGVNDLDVLLDPAPSSIPAGFSLFVLVTSNNTGPVNIDINGMGAIPIKKNIDADLANSDISNGQIIHLIYDGSSFQLLNSRDITRRECPNGFVEVNSQFCIEQNEHDTLTFFQAAMVCGDLGGRLCTWGEWNWACRDTTLNLSDMTGNWEWTGSTANGDHLVRVVGESTCTQSATSPDQPTPARNFRCCYSR